jgi:hypothetical protein
MLAWLQGGARGLRRDDLSIHSLQLPIARWSLIGGPAGEYSSLFFPCSFSCGFALCFAVRACVQSKFVANIPHEISIEIVNKL